MYHWLLTIFSAVCGENPKHIWSPGGQPLPCCERCTGLYVAALIAVALHFWLRPCISKRFLQVHALCLLQLGSFVFPWLPQSPVLRTVSGTLFGFGVVAFLWPAIAARQMGKSMIRSSRSDETHTFPLHSSVRVSSPRLLQIQGALAPFSLSRAGTYTLGMAACAAMTAVIAERGGATGAFVLMCLISAGALALSVLAGANLVRCLFPFLSRNLLVSHEHSESQ
jgi:uncharacterized membrane protein